MSTIGNAVALLKIALIIFSSSVTIATICNEKEKLKVKTVHYSLVVLSHYCIHMLNYISVFVHFIVTKTKKPLVLLSSKTPGGIRAGRSKGWARGRISGGRRKVHRR